MMEFHHIYAEEIFQNFLMKFPLVLYHVSVLRANPFKFMDYLQHPQ